MPVTADSAASSASVVPTPPTSRQASQWRRAGRYALSSTTLTLTRGMFVFFTIALPVVMFLMFSTIFGGATTEGTTVSTIVMIRMAAYGGLGAAINSGALIQLERTNGWLRQLMVAGLTPRSFLVGRLVSSMVVVLPALIGVYAAGYLVAGIRLPLATALLSLLFMWIGMIPLVLLGLVLAMSIKPSAAMAVITIGMMLLSIVGGLWFPYEMFPSWLQTIADITPSRWAAEFGTWMITGQSFPAFGGLVMIAWTAVLAVLAGLLLARSARSTPRR